MGNVVHLVSWEDLHYFIVCDMNDYVNAINSFSPSSSSSLYVSNIPNYVPWSPFIRCFTSSFVAVVGRGSGSYYTAEYGGSAPSLTLSSKYGDRMKPLITE